MGFAKPETTSAKAEDRRDSESGVALILGIFFTIIIVGLVFSGTIVLKTNRVRTETSFRLHGQASQFARAGLMEALGWFRKQTSQPVMAFNPLLNPTATPPVLDTIDPNIGIVREFEIAGQVWGRYEVWKQWDTDPDTVRRTFRQQMQVSDVSLQRGAMTAGNVWRVRSLGYVYRRINGGVPYDTYPNSVMGSEIIETEYQRLTLAPPGSAAICTYSGSATSTNAKTRVEGGGTGAGIFYRTAGGAPTVAAGSVTGSPPQAATASYAGSVVNVFGVSEEDLAAMADDRITNNAMFPFPLSNRAMLYCNVPTLTFTAARPLRGDGLVFVKGNVDFQTGNNSWFTGMMYVDGAVTLNAPLEFNGTLIATGGVTVSGISDFCNISYDSLALNRLRAEVGQYRLSGAFRVLNSAE